MFYSYGSCQNKGCVECAIRCGEIDAEIADFIRLIFGRASKHFIVSSPVHDPKWQGIADGEYWSEGACWADWSRRVSASAVREKAQTTQLEAISNAVSHVVSAGEFRHAPEVASLSAPTEEPISSRKGRPKKYGSRSEQMKAYRERKKEAAA